MEEAEAACIFREAMRRYSYNNLSDESLGLFKGLEDGAIIVSMELDGIDLKVTPYTEVDVTQYEKKIANLQAVVEEQNAEIEALKEKKAETEETATSLTTATKSASVRKRRKS